MKPQGIATLCQTGRAGGRTEEWSAREEGNWVYGLGCSLESRGPEQKGEGILCK